MLIVKEPGNVYCLPDRSLLLRNKEKTKIRAVYDASCSYDRPCDRL